MKSIRTKLIIYFALLIVVSSTALGTLSVVNARKSLVGEAEGALRSMVEGGVKTTQGRMETQTKILEVMASTSDIIGMSWNVQKRFLEI